MQRNSRPHHLFSRLCVLQMAMHLVELVLQVQLLRRLVLQLPAACVVQDFLHRNHTRKSLVLHLLCL